MCERERECVKEKINVCVQEVHHLCVPRKSERERVRKRCTYCDKIIVCASKRERERERGGKDSVRKGIRSRCGERERMCVNEIDSFCVC